MRRGMLRRRLSTSNLLLLLLAAPQLCSGTNTCRLNEPPLISLRCSAPVNTDSSDLMGSSGCCAAPKAGQQTYQT